MSMTTDEPMFVREVALVANPGTSAGRMAGHRARRLIDGDPAFSDPFVVMAEDWMPRGAFPRHPHRGMETVTFVIDGAVEHRDSAGNAGMINADGAQWMTAGRGGIPRRKYASRNDGPYVATMGEFASGTEDVRATLSGSSGQHDARQARAGGRGSSLLGSVRERKLVHSQSCSNHNAGCAN